jgi:hypothetical protein
VQSKKKKKQQNRVVLENSAAPILLGDPKELLLYIGVGGTGKSYSTQNEIFQKRIYMRGLFWNCRGARKKGMVPYFRNLVNE